MSKGIHGFVVENDLHTVSQHPKFGNVMYTFIIIIYLFIIVTCVHITITYFKIITLLPVHYGTYMSL